MTPAFIISILIALVGACFVLVFLMERQNQRDAFEIRRRFAALSSALRQTQDELAVIQLRFDDLSVYRATPLNKITAPEKASI